MSVMQVTSFAYQTSCAWCNAVRQAAMAPLIKVYKGILISRQSYANYRVAEQLAGHGDYRGMTVSEVANVLNKQTI
jgi:hypothetical protein